MKKVSTVLIIGLLCFSMLPILTHQAKGASSDISAQYSSFVSAFNNYKKIFGQDVSIGQTVERTLSGIINDSPAHYQWHSWAGHTYPNLDGFSIRIETIQAEYVYRIIGIGQMGGSQPSASGWVQVNSPFKIEQINYAENYTYPTPWGDSYVRIYVNATTGRIDFVAKWYNWPALIDAPAFRFAITIAKPGGLLPPFSLDTTRTQASYAYDSDAKRVVMFGGFTHWTRDLNPDIWAFNPSTSDWIFVSVGSGPTGRGAATMSYNPAQDNFLVFGGATLSGAESDTWKFHFTDSVTGTWTNVPAAGPSARVGAPMVYDQNSNLFVLFGGESYVYSLGDTWAFDPVSNTWMNKNPSPAPPQRGTAAMAFDVQSGKVLLFGGLNKGAGSLLSDTWLYDAATNTWQQVSTPTAPSARQWPSLACDGNGIFYLFGGWRVDAGGGLGQYLDDTWKFDMATMQWTQLFPLESPIAQSQAAFVNLGSGRFVLLNGWRDSPLGDIWFYDSTQNTWSMEVVPAPLTAHIDINPDTLNLNSKGKWITSYIEFPEGYNMNDIDVSTILLNDTVPAELYPTEVGDYDSDGVPDLMVKFNRTAVSEYILSKGIMTGNVTLTITGQLDDGTLFQGSDVIRVRMPGDVNIDGKVDIRDIAFAAKAFGSYPGHPRWNPIADENEDNEIDIRDIGLIAKNFGKTYP